MSKRYTVKSMTLSQFPYRNSLLLGGHPNLVKKIRQVFPKWQYIDANQVDTKPRPSTEYVFFCSLHCSHKTSNFVRRKLKGNEKWVYLTATNLEQLLVEMETQLLCAA